MNILQRIGLLILIVAWTSAIRFPDSVLFGFLTLIALGGAIVFVVVGDE